MRTLRFLVDGQIIEKDPKCDFSGLVSGTEGYLRAEFSFSNEWDKCHKAASFWKFGEENPIILENNACIIPAAALTYKFFEVSVMGMRKGYTITTNRIRVEQGGGTK